MQHSSSSSMQYLVIVIKWNETAHSSTDLWNWRGCRFCTYKCTLWELHAVLCQEFHLTVWWVWLYECCAPIYSCIYLGLCVFMLYVCISNLMENQNQVEFVLMNGSFSRIQPDLLACFPPSACHLLSSCVFFLFIFVAVWIILAIIYICNHCGMFKYELSSHSKEYSIQMNKNNSRTRTHECESFYTHFDRILFLSFNPLLFILDFLETKMRAVLTNWDYHSLVSVFFFQSVR